MRVDFTNLGFEPPEKNKAGRTGPAGRAAGTAGAGNAGAAVDSSGGADRARFSFDLARVQSLAAQALAAPEVRHEKVAPLQQAIANGDYQVDPGKVAAAIAAETGGGSFR